MPLWGNGDNRNWKTKKSPAPTIRSDDSDINLGNVKCPKCKKTGIYNSIKRFYKLKTKGPCQQCFKLSVQKPTSMKSSAGMMDPASPKHAAPKTDIETEGGGEIKN